MGFLKKMFGKTPHIIGAPAAGEVVPVTQVNDPTFREEILGKGVAIRPAEGKIYAPCDATVDIMFDTGHAVSLVASFDAEILIHIGLDTVRLGGKHYTIHARTGERVKKGQLLIEFDMDAIRAEGYDLITPLVICNSSCYSTINTLVNRDVLPGDPVIELIR